MIKTPAALDAITDTVLAYRPTGAGENAAAIARKSIKATCPQCGAKRGFYCASNCPNAK